MIHLEPCPFCGQELEQRNSKYNPYARCTTPDCAGGKLPLISLDVPEDIERWNRRDREQVLAAHVERLREALNPFASGGAAACISRGDYSVMRERLKDWMGVKDFERADEALRETPATSLARRDAAQQENGRAALIDRFQIEHPDYPVAAALLGILSAKLRRQAEEPTE